ncbi:ATP-binding protein [Streptomyces niveiscabiei]|uniref:ATP-binding protein n=1 Tax=Streptomyces niveiscabiei TaxID=164115 RepID=UPI0006EB3B1F|nr:ATP-binding protein [Streptomyces niveiscabiei]
MTTVRVRIAAAVRSRSTGHPNYSVALPRTPEAVGEARFFARVVLGTWHLTGPVVDDAVLLLSEMVTNAVVHGDGLRITISIDRPAPGRVLLAVRDRAHERVPRRRSPGPGDTSGRGLHLLDALAIQWGCDRWGPPQKPVGKRVWAELDAQPTTDRTS